MSIITNSQYKQIIMTKQPFMERKVCGYKHISVKDSRVSKIYEFEAKDTIAIDGIPDASMDLIFCKNMKTNDIERFLSKYIREVHDNISGINRYMIDRIV